MARVDSFGKIIWENTYQEKEIVEQYSKREGVVAKKSLAPFDCYMTDKDRSNALMDESKNKSEMIDSCLDFIDRHEKGLTINLDDKRLVPRINKQNIVPMEIIVEDGVSIPKYAHNTDAGFDLMSAEHKAIKPFETLLFKTGIYLNIPFNYEVQIRSRSGNALKGLVVANSPGCIDCGYIGEIKVILHNNTENHIIIECGDKIAQAVLTPIVKAHFIVVDGFEKTERGDNGFGSTGK